LKAELGGEARSAFQALATLRSTAPASPAAEAAGTTRRDTPAAGADRPNPGTPPAAKTTPAADAAARYTSWSFGELPELLEVRRGAQSLIGFPALIDRADHVQIEVFDEPDVAATKHRAGLQRLVALQLKDMLKVLGKQLPELQAMSMAYLALGGTPEELRDQILDRAIDRAFLAAPLPTDGL
jgi:ATP-dependent helicase HrpA